MTGSIEGNKAQVDKAGYLKGPLKGDTIWLNDSPESLSAGFKNSGRRAKLGLIMFRLTLQFKCLMLFHLPLLPFALCSLDVPCLLLNVLIMK